MADPNAPDWAQQAPSWASQPASGGVPSWATQAPPPVKLDPNLAQSKSQGATGFFDQVGQTWDDATNPNHPQHDPNAIESGIIGTAYSKPVQYLQGEWNQNAVTGLFAQPVRAAMEKLGVGRQYGESDASLHQRYGQAMDAARQQAQDQITNNQVGSYGPGSNIPDWAARFTQQASGVAAGVAANPQYTLIPGMGLGGSMAVRTGTAIAGNAGVGSVSDAAAQLMDMVEGQKKDFDIVQNLKSAAFGGLVGGALHGAVEGGSIVSDYVKSLFANRGMDTTPAANPVGSTIQPMTTDQFALNASDHAQYQQLLHTGSVDDIKNFFNGKQGPHPSYQDVNTWVEHRDNPPAATNGQSGPDPSRQPDFNYNDEYNAHHEQQYAEQNRQAVEDHVNAKMAGWQNAPQVEVVHSPADIADPGIRAEVQAQDPNNDALGVFGSDGKMRMFSGRITDPDTASAVLFHEGLGHYGLAQKFGDKLDATLGSMLDRNVNGLSKETDAWQQRNPGAYGGDRIRAAEEVLAERSESGAAPKSWKDAISSSVRQFGRKMGLKLAYSDAEVSHILAMSHDAVINGKPDAASNGFRGAVQKLQGVGAHGEINGNRFMFAGPKGIREEGERPFVASDGMARQEFSDRNARLYESPGDTLGSTLHHPELFDRYPELHSMPVHRMNNPEYAGYYDTRGGNHIMLNPNSFYDPLNVALHETQHAIQHIEESPHFMKAITETEGTAGSSEEDYNNHPSEKEAREVEGRRGMSDWQRQNNPPNKFMRQTDALGNVKEDPNELDMVDRLKADPRYWSDQEYRSNVNELARTRFPPDGPVNKFITRSQMDKAAIARKGFDPDDIEGIAQHIQNNYEKNTVSWDETREQALKLGINPKTISKLSEGNPGDLAARVARIGAAADYATVKVKSILDRLDTPDWKPEDHVNLAQAIAERNYLVERFKGQTNEVGRALNTAKVFKQYSNGNISDVLTRLQEEGSGLAGLADPSNPEATKFARQLKQALGSNSNPQAAQTLMAGVNKPYWEQYLTTIHMNMMLSALSTHVKAPVDMATGIIRNVVEKAVAMPIGEVRKAVMTMTGRTPKQGVEAAELFNHVIGIAKAVSDAEVYRQSWNAAKTGNSSYVVNGKATPTNFANTFGATSNPRIPGVSIPTQLISAQDTFFRSVEINAQLMSLGVRDARDTLGPKASTSDVMTLGHHNAMNPTPSILKEAYDLTNRTLLLNDNPLNNIVNKARVYKPGMNGMQRFGAFVATNLMPFIRVESNSLMNRVIQRSPLALLDPYTISQLKAGGAKADIAMSKIIYGTTLLGLMFSAAIKGTTTGDGPGDVDQYKQKIASGWRPDAVKEADGKYITGGNSLGMSVNPFDMHNKTAQMVASMKEAYDAGANKGQVASGLMLSFGSLMSNLARQSWASDIDPALSAVTAQGQEGQSQVSSFANREMESWIPNILGQIARVTDPNQRDTRAVGSPAETFAGQLGHTIMGQIPGVREQLPIKYSVYGEPLAGGATWSGVHTPLGLSGNGTMQTSDPTEMELDRLNASLPDIKKTLSPADAAELPQTLVTPVQRIIKLDDGTPKILTPAEFETYQQKAGRYIVKDVEGEMSNPGWQSMSDHDKVLIVRDIVKDQKANAREELFNQ